jgi:uncharacterized membrane protein YesL
VRFLGFIWRGIRDVFDQFVFSIGLSLAWWLCAVPVALGFLTLPLFIFLVVSPLLAALLAPATVTLFSMADPRRIVSRPDIAEAIAVFRTSIKRGWLIGICTVPVLLVLFWNVTYFAGTDSFLAAFVPLWMIMLIALFILMLYMFSVAGTMESGLRNAFRGAMYVLVSRPFTALLLSLLIILLGGVMTILVLPMLALGPALMAAVVNRFVLAGLDVEVIDPNAPTSEREVERERGVHHDKTFWERLRGSGRRT